MCRLRNFKNYKHIKLKKIIMRDSIIKLSITVAKQKSSKRKMVYYIPWNKYKY